ARAVRRAPPPAGRSPRPPPRWRKGQGTASEPRPTAEQTRGRRPPASFEFARSRSRSFPLRRRSPGSGISGWMRQSGAASKKLALVANLEFGAVELRCTNGRNDGSGGRTVLQNCQVILNVINLDLLTDEGAGLGAGVHPGLPARVVDQRRVRHDLSVRPAAGQRKPDVHALAGGQGPLNLRQRIVSADHPGAPASQNRHPLLFSILVLVVVRVAILFVVVVH